MKFNKRLLFIGLATVAIGSLLSVKLIQAENTSLSNSQIEIVRDNCLYAKNQLNQLRVNDALLRVNMGQIYEALSTKLMTGFNGRVAHNGLDNSHLVDVSNDYKYALSVFRDDYKIYEEQLSYTIGIDCMTEPENFYNAVNSTRYRREQVYNSVLALNKQIDFYVDAIDGFRNDFIVSGDN